MANTTHQTEVVVIGGGPAGYPCAIRLAQLGKKVTVIDRAELGGVCLNRGCIPSKALIHAASTFEKAKHAADMGIELTGAKVNMTKLMEWKNSVVNKLTGGVGQLLKGNGCTILQGDAKFVSNKTLEVRGKDGSVTTVQFQQCVIATGSRPAELPGFKVDQKRILDSTGALSQTEIPKSMLCIGGGYIGLELGTFYAKVGTKVTVVEPFPNILGAVDPDLTKVVQRKLEKMGVKIMTKTSVKGCKVGSKDVEVNLQPEGGAAVTEKFETVLVTIGRTPNSEGMDLAKAGVKTDSKGFIPVGPQRQTNVPNIYAIGDIAGQPLLAHKGTKEGIICAEAIAGLKVEYDVAAIPAVIFTDPEIATVGMTEAEARSKGIDVMVGNFPIAVNGRALSMKEPEGTVKMVGDKKTGRLLGVHIVGVEASNLISEAALAIEMGATVEDVALTVHPHPTLGELLMEAAEATLGHAIHIVQRKPAASSHAPQARA